MYKFQASLDVVLRLANQTDVVAKGQLLQYCPVSKLVTRAAGVVDRQEALEGDLKSRWSIWEGGLSPPPPRLRSREGWPACPALRLL